MADEPTDPPALQDAPANGTPTENTNGNGDENGDNEPVRPTIRPNATRKKRRRKNKKTHNPQDIIYGPSFKLFVIPLDLVGWLFGHWIIMFAVAGCQLPVSKWFILVQNVPDHLPNMMLLIHWQMTADCACVMNACCH